MFDCTVVRSVRSPLISASRAASWVKSTMLISAMNGVSVLGDAPETARDCTSDAGPGEAAPAEPECAAPEPGVGSAWVDAVPPDAGAEEAVLAAGTAELPAAAVAPGAAGTAPVAATSEAGAGPPT